MTDDERKHLIKNLEPGQMNGEIFKIWESLVEEPPLDPYCWVCRTHHELIASKCPGMWDIA